MNHWNITIQGKVQKVFFRVTTKAVADQLGIKGFVMNQPDGTVYVEAEGDDFALASFLEFCEEGPEDAKVSSVNVQKSNELKNFKNFEVVKRPK